MEVLTEVEVLLTTGKQTTDGTIGRDLAYTRCVTVSQVEDLDGILRNIVVPVLDLP